jgi:hypothetical protein
MANNLLKTKKFQYKIKILKKKKSFFFFLGFLNFFLFLILKKHLFGLKKFYDHN